VRSRLGEGVGRGRTAVTSSAAATSWYGGAMSESCPGCIGRGAGSVCCICGRPIPGELRRRPGDASEITEQVAEMVRRRGAGKAQRR